MNSSWGGIRTVVWSLMPPASAGATRPSRLTGPITTSRTWTAGTFTYLNEVKVDPKGPPQLLKDEDKVKFCDLEYVFRNADPPPPNGGILFVDDDVESSSSTIMSKVGVSSGPRGGAIDGQSGSEAQRTAGNQSQSGSGVGAWTRSCRRY